jgi:ATP-dependent DNA helicase RecG
MKPLNKSKLKSLISKGETGVLEFKRNFGQEVIVSISAFANTRGGSVLVGVDDDGGITGVNIAEETIQNWVNEIKQKTDPCIIPDTEVIVVNKKTVVVLSVKEFPVKPVSVQGRYYKRVSNSNHKLTLNEIYDLYIKAFNLSWDYHTDPQLSLSMNCYEKVS